ncbi:MAG: BrnA antitoxin family protein [Propionibacteriaceae bacterium]|nr:BrnA antitoxin family protein [Propionibacteriaceae bacterium]
MRTEYDFSNAKPNPYVHHEKKQITIRLDTDTIEYFQELAEQVGLRYQTLINLYLADAARTHKQLAWV